MQLKIFDIMKRYSYIFIVLLAVLCRFPVYGQPPEKEVAILEVANKDGSATRGDCMMIQGHLIIAVRNAGYKGYERTAEDIARILGEHNFQRTGMVSDDQIKELGKMASGQYVLASEVARMSNGKLAISAKILNVETSGIPQNSIVQTTADDLEKDCLKLVRDLFGQGGTYGNNDGNGVSGYGVQTQSKKQTIAICVMRDNSDPKIVSYAKVFASELADAVVRSAKYNAVERTGEFLEVLSQVQSYQRTGQVDGSMIAELGKRVGVDFVLSVDMTDFGNNSIYVVWKLIDVETAVIQYGDSELKRIVNMVADWKALSEAIAKKITG